MPQGCISGASAVLGQAQRQEITMDTPFFELYVNLPEDGESYPVVMDSDGGIHTPDDGYPTLLAQADLGKVLLALVEQEGGNFALEITRTDPETWAAHR